MNSSWWNQVLGKPSTFPPSEHINKVQYVFDDVTERDAFFAANPTLLVEDAVILIKDTTPPPTPGTRSLNYSIPYNSQYKTLTF